MTAALQGEVEVPSPLDTLKDRLRDEWFTANEELTFRSGQLQELNEGKRLMAQRHRRQLAELKEQQAREVEQHQDLVDNETRLHARLQQALTVIDGALGSINALTMETPAKVLADASPKRLRKPKAAEAE